MSTHNIQFLWRNQKNISLNTPVIQRYFRDGIFTDLIYYEISTILIIKQIKINHQKCLTDATVLWCKMRRICLKYSGRQA